MPTPGYPKFCWDGSMAFHVLPLPVASAMWEFHCRNQRIFSVVNGVKGAVYIVPAFFVFFLCCREARFTLEILALAMHAPVLLFNNVVLLQYDIIRLLSDQFMTWYLLFNVILFVLSVPFTTNLGTMLDVGFLMYGGIVTWSTCSLSDASRSQLDMTKVNLIILFGVSLLLMSSGSLLELAEVGLWEDAAAVQELREHPTVSKHWNPRATMLTSATNFVLAAGQGLLTLFSMAKDFHMTATIESPLVRSSVFCV
jgi:hypothetical protein